MALAKITNAADYTYSPSFTFDGNLPTEIFMKPSEATPALSDIFSIRQGIRTDEYLVLASEQSKIVVANPGCQPTYVASGTLSDRRIQVSKLGVYREWCKDDWTAVANQLSNDPSWVGDGLDGYQLGAKLQRFLVDATIDAVRRDIFALSFFGNDTAINSFWRPMEGLFVKMYDANASYCVKRVGNSFPNQFNSVLTAGQALTAFQAVATGSNNRLKSIANNQKMYLTTQSVYENLLASYESNTSGSETQFRILTDGTPKLYYRGVEVVAVPFFDSLLEDSTNPWYNSLRHFIILMPKASSSASNLVLGTENAADLNKLEVFYDQRLRTQYMQADFRLGVQFINCDLIAFHD